MSKRSRFRRFLMFGVVLGLIAAACGGDDDDPESGDPTSTTGGAAQPAGDFDPAGEYTVAWSLGPVGFDPHIIDSQNVAHPYLSPVYDRLTLLNKDGEIEPMLATDWEFSEDGTTFTMNLRDDVDFHDGEHFDAEAAAANLERAQTHPGATSTAEHLQSVTEIEIVDEYTIRLHVEPGAIALPFFLSSSTGMMVSPAAFENPDLDRNPVGSGPYEVESYTPSERATFVRADGEYWGGPEAAKAARFTLINMPDDTARVNALEAGEVDFINVRGGALPRAIELAEDNPDEYQLVRVSTSAWHGAPMNRDAASLQDMRVRQALNYALDKDALVEFFGGNCLVTGQPLKPGWPGYDPVLEDFYDFDPDRARELLAEAGFGPDNPLTIEVLQFAGLEPQQTMAVIFQEMWAEVGITANLTPLEFSEGLEVFRGGRTDMWPGQSSAHPNSEIQLIRRLNPVQNPGDLANFSERVNDLYEDLDDQTIQGDDREQLLTDLNRAMVEDAAFLEVCWDDAVMLGKSYMVGTDNIPLTQVAVYDPRYLGVSAER